jgi:predicted DNA-binding transcriptional regulator AlpA
MTAATVYLEELLRITDVMKLTKLGKRTIHRLRFEKRFPQPIYPTRKTPRWKRSDIEQWIAKLTG